MKYRVVLRQGTPAYLQLYRQLREDIASGVYPFGNKLPSKRLLAEEVGVSVITVEHAYSILCDEGYAESRQRSGYFVTYREKEFLLSEGCEASAVPVSPLSHGHSEFPFSVLAKTVRKVLAEYGERILIKSPNQGCLELRTAICRYLARNHGISVQPSQVIIGSGAEYFYSLLAQLLGKNHVFGLESPSYDKIRLVYEANGITCRMLPMGRDGVDSRALEDTDATVLHVTPFHSFPSGITADVSKRMEYLHWAQERQGYLIEDNYDSELTVSTKHEDTLFSMADHGRVVYLNTFSRTVAPSLRIGYLILPPLLLEQFQHRLGFYSCTVPVLDQYVLAELIDSGDFQRHINRIRRKRRQQ